MASEVRILDVGHGNCSLILASKNCVIDCPGNTILVDTLNKLGISHIDVVLVSHADADHLVGINNLLLDKNVTVGSLYANPNSERSSLAFRTFLVAIEDAIQRGVRAQNTLTAEVPGKIESGDITLEILSPGGAASFVGVGGRTLSGDKITTNSASAVIRVSYKGESKVLLPGDMSASTFIDLRRRGISLLAPILVFPHHGGIPEVGDAAGFADALIRAVDPDIVIFSLGRGRYGTPRPEIISAVRAAKPLVRIACTQLSENCAKVLHGLTFGHLDAAPAHGRKSTASCAGSLTFNLDVAATSNTTLNRHQDWVTAEIAGALCRISSI